MTSSGMQWTKAEPGHISPNIDTSTANVARMYDYYLGGKTNFAAIISFAGQAQVIGAKRRTASDKIVYHLVEQGKVWHRTSAEFFQKPR